MGGMNTPEGELFYVNGKGERKDAELHEEMLSSEAGNEASTNAAIKQAVSMGFTPEEALRLFSE